MYTSSTNNNTTTSNNKHTPQGPQGFSPYVNNNNPSPSSSFEIDGSLRSRNARLHRRTPGRGPPPPKTTLAAALMLVTGTILLCVGLSIRWHTDPKEKERGLALIILGSLLFIPGSYASFQLFGAWAGWPGYSYNYIPSYDD